MQAPPGSRRPPVLFTRRAHDWLNRVAEKHRQFTSLQLSPEKRASLDCWQEERFVQAAVSLEGLEITDHEVARAIAALRQGIPASDIDVRIRQTFHGLRLVLSVSQIEGTSAALTPDLLLRMSGAIEFRKGPGDARRPLKPIPPARVAVGIESACQWFSAESFLELNPIEQASIAHLRLIEIQPFEEENERAAILAASFFTVRRGLPPLVITPDMAAAYRAAIGEAGRGNTQPMVELTASAVETTLSEMIALAE